MTTSMAVAEHFSKNHFHVLRLIREKIGTYADPTFTDTHFVPATRINTQGKEQPIYHLTELGFSLIAMGFTGDAAAKWQRAYAETFLAMRQALTNGLNERLAKAEKLANDWASSAQKSWVTDSEFMLRVAHMTTFPESVLVAFFMNAVPKDHWAVISIANLQRALDKFSVDVRYSEAKVRAATIRLASRGLMVIQPASNRTLAYRLNTCNLYRMVEKCPLPWRQKWKADSCSLALSDPRKINLVNRNWSLKGGHVFPSGYVPWRFSGVGMTGL